MDADEGACGSLEVDIVDKVRLNKSIMSCSFVVLMGEGDTGTTAKASLGIGMGLAGVTELEILVPSLPPIEVL